MLEKIYILISRLFFLMAIAILAFTLWGRFIEEFGWTYSFSPYSSGRLLAFSGLLLIFVIAMYLRQIRNELRAKKQ